MMRYSVESKTRNYFKECGFISLTRKYKIQIMDKGLDASKIADALIKSHDDSTEKQEPVEEVIIQERNN